MFKVRKTKKGISINGINVGDTTYEERIEKSNVKDINQTRPSLIREFNVKKIDSDVDIDIELLKKELDIKSDVIQEDLDYLLERRDAYCYNEGRHNKWGNKAIALLLNELFGEELFTY